jgi:hypothetical protein
MGSELWGVVWNISTLMNIAFLMIVVIDFVLFLPLAPRVSFWAYHRTGKG